jgi:hypothetical protein
MNEIANGNANQADRVTGDMCGASLQFFHSCRHLRRYAIALTSTPPLSSFADYKSLSGLGRIGSPAKLDLCCVGPVLEASGSGLDPHITPPGGAPVDLVAVYFQCYVAIFS